MMKRPLSTRLLLPAFFSALLLVLAGDHRGADEKAPRVRKVWAEPSTNSLGAPSADDRFLSFVDAETGDLALLDLATRAKRRLTDNHSRGPSAEFAYFSVIAPNGRDVAYAWFNDEKFYDLRVIGIEDLKPRVLYRNEEAGFVQPCAWSPDGKRILTLFFRKDNISQIALVSAADGSVQVLKSLNWVYPNRMDLSPDGRYIVYDDLAAQGSAQRDIFVLSVDGSREVRIVDHTANDLFPLWTRSGNGILFASDRAGTIDLWFLPFAGEGAWGEPALIRRDLGRVLPMGVTRDGTYYYGLRTGTPGVRMAVIDPKTGSVTESRRPAEKQVAAANTIPEWSPDGRHLAYLARVGNENFGQESRTIAIHSLESGAERDVSPTLAFLERLRWSPDGRSLLVSGSDRHGYSGLYLVDARSGGTRPLVRERVATYRGLEGAWSADGKAVFYVRDEEKGSQIRLRQLEGGEERELHRAEAAARLRHLALSPDGHYLAFSSGSAKDHIETLLVMPAGGGPPRRLATVRNAEVRGVEWMRDGNELLFLTAGNPPTIWRVRFQGGAPQKLNSTLEGCSGFRLHPDGQRLALICGEMRSEVWAIDNAVPILSGR